MKKIVFLLFIFAFSSVSAFSQINEIMKRMDAHWNALKTLQSDIKINKFSVESNENYMREGTVRFLAQKNDFLLRIDSTKPTAESFSIINTQYLLFQSNPNPFYLTDVKTAYQGTITDSQKNTFAIFSDLSKEVLKAKYNIKYTGEEKVNGTIPVWHLELIPRARKNYKKLEFWVNADGMPIQSKVYENNGDWTSVLLNNLQKNNKMKENDFKIDLPKDTKIIKN